jgi:hypothetical protein
MDLALLGTVHGTSKSGNYRGYFAKIFLDLIRYCPGTAPDSSSTIITFQEISIIVDIP